MNIQPGEPWKTETVPTTWWYEVREAVLVAALG
jgi:hypothetical protein